MVSHSDSKCRRNSTGFHYLSQTHYMHPLLLQNVMNTVHPIDCMDSHQPKQFSNIWVTSWENLFIPYAKNKGTDQPAHPRSLIRAFVVCCLYSIISLVSISKISRLQLVSAAEQACLSLNWPETPLTGFLITMLISTWIRIQKIRHTPWPERFYQTENKCSRT